MPFSKKFMDRAPALAAAGLIRPHFTTAQSRNTYILPLRASAVTEVGSKGISPTHQGQMINSIDFFVPEGTPIIAAADGIVVEMMKSSNTTGMRLEDWPLGNHVELQHALDEYTWYEHLKYNEVYVKIGDKVKAGQLIALSGNTGFSEIAHLHFQVTQYPGEDWLDFVTVKARFVSIDGLPGDPYAKND
jgi:murein DD-endopeptidase MepM/ murein hydrolase activator NlpD